MKKLLTAACILASGSLLAQEIETAPSLFPAKGSITAEVSLNLFGDGNTIDFNSYTNGIKARYFLNSNLAIRFGLGYNGSNQTNHVGPGVFPGSDTLPMGSQVLKSSEIIFTPGIECHFNSNGRLSPYVGADIIFSTKSASESLKNAQVQQAFWPGPFPTPAPGYQLYYAQDYSAENENGNSIGEKAGTTIGLRLLAGMDYYLSTSFYLGTEFGFEYTSTSNKEYVQNITYKDWQTNTIKSERRTTPGDENTATKATILKGIRLGFRF